MKFPEDFGKSEWLGDLIEKARDAQPGSALLSLKNRLPDLIAINDYSKRYHHAQNAAADSEPINATEVQAYARRTLRFITG